MLIDKNDYCFSYTDNTKNLVYRYSLASDIYCLSNKDFKDTITDINYEVNLNYDKIKQYDTNSSDYNKQAIGTINIKFRQNSSIYDKNFDLVLINVSKAPFTFSHSRLKNIFIYLTIIILVVFVLWLTIKSFQTQTSKSKRKKLKKRFDRRRLAR